MCTYMYIYIYIYICMYTYIYIYMRQFAFNDYGRCPSALPLGRKRARTTGYFRKAPKAGSCGEPPTKGDNTA